jgi:hypothetical protein
MPYHNKDRTHYLGKSKHHTFYTSTRSPVTDEYKAGAQFTGKIRKVVVDLVGEKHHDPEAEAKVAMMRQ